MNQLIGLACRVEAPFLQNKLAQVGVLRQRRDAFVHVLGVDLERAA